MTAQHDLDRELTALLREGPTELPNESFDAVRDRTEQTRQRVILGPWRLPEMNKILTAGLAAAAVVVVLLVGAQFFRSPSGGVGTDDPTASPTSQPVRGQFTYSVGFGNVLAVEMDASSDGSSLSGTAIVSSDSETLYTVQLQCLRRFDDQTWVLAGAITPQPEGAGVTTWTAVVVRDGSPQSVDIVGEPAAAADDCEEFLTHVPRADGIHFEPMIEGGITLPPDSPATPEPSPTPDGFLPEGPFVWSDPAVEPAPFDGGPLITVTIPASGWTSDGALMKGDEVDNLPEAAMLVMPTRADVYVYGDPCRYESTRPDTPATTVDEIAAALAAQPSRDASAPVDVTVDGYAGKFITLHVPDDASPDDCEGAEYASFYVEGDEEPGRYHQGGGQVDDFWILDVDGAIVIIDAMYRPDSQADLVDEMRSIAESATFD